MSITLPTELEQMLKAKVNQGQYASVDAAVVAAVHYFLDHEPVAGAWDAEVEEAQAQIRRGEFIEGEAVDAFFEELLSDKPKV